MMSAQSAAWYVGLSSLRRLTRMVCFLTCIAGFALMLSACGNGGSSGGASPLSISTTSLPGGTTGTAYSATLKASGGTTPYTWSIASGALPSWARLDASAGTITGTPDAGGTTNFTVKVTDSVNTTATKALSITVGTKETFGFVNYDSNGTLNGDVANESSVGTASLDGAGGYTASDTKNVVDPSTSAQSITSQTGSGAYNLGSNGSITLTDSSGMIVGSGSISADSSAIVLASIASGNVPSITAGVTPLSGGSDVSLNGTYLFSVYDDNGVTNGFPNDEGDIITGTLDGAGNYTASEVKNAWQTDTNTQSLSSANLSGTYSVSGSGTFTLKDASNNVIATGYVGIGGIGIIIGETTPGQIPQIGAAVKLDQGGTNADLNGTYVVTTYDNNGTLNGDVANEGSLVTLSFDGKGSFSGSETHNVWDTSKNKQSVTNSSRSGSYSVASDGTLTIEDSGGTIIATGGVAVGGDMIVIGDVESGSTPTIGVGVRQ